MPDGTQVQGSFFHYAMGDKPLPRDEMKAKALIADFVEDYFLTNVGERRPYTFPSAKGGHIARIRASQQFGCPAKKSAPRPGSAGGIK